MKTGGENTSNLTIPGGHYQLDWQETQQESYLKYLKFGGAKSSGPEITQMSSLLGLTLLEKKNRKSESRKKKQTRCVLYSSTAGSWGGYYVCRWLSCDSLLAPEEAYLTTNTDVRRRK